MERRPLDRRLSFLTTNGVVGHTIWTSAAPVLTYPLYAREWGLSTATTTEIFAVYPIFVVLMLVLFGNISDHVGRRETMLAGLIASGAGTLLFAVAPDVGWLYVGRALMGIGVGLSAGPSAAAVVEYSLPGRAGDAGSATAASQAAGMIGASLMGGALIEYAPLPTRLNFAILFVLILALAVATYRLPAHVAAQGHRWRPRIPSVPRGLGATFATATLAVTTAYGLGAITLSLGSQVARDVIASENSLVNGATIALFAVTVGLASLPARGRPADVTLMSGTVATLVAAASLAAAAAWHSLSLYILSQAIAGVAYSWLFLGGLTLINAATPVATRGATLSALFLVGYLAQAAIALSLGRVASSASLSLAVDVGAAVSVVMVLLTQAANLIRRGAREDGATGACPDQVMAAASTPSPCRDRT